jgi:hypothetical protein
MKRGKTERQQSPLNANTHDRGQVSIKDDPKDFKQPMNDLRDSCRLEEVRKADRSDVEETLHVFSCNRFVLMHAANIIIQTRRQTHLQLVNAILRRATSDCLRNLSIMMDLLTAFVYQMDHGSVGECTAEQRESKYSNC